ncbi:hypothetical protein DFH11DRAFT_797327 [Phellopilus nigrolimitatus]|nr:hypothetical protein DFH11DRAFT_797327 [Phellopilus nigrolimitatus]
MSVCVLPALHPPSKHTQGFETQIPFSKGIGMPVLEAHYQSSLSTNMLESEQHSRPSLRRINTGVSLAKPEETESAISDSFLFSSSVKGVAFQNNSLASLSGPYISQSSRKDFSEWKTGALTSPFSPSPSSYSAIYDFSDDAAEAEDELDSEDVWNLVPYDISWGPLYYGYKEGTLPGPDGKCVFLRSPTPLKYQRTNQACDKCRERKAKCSGTRPSCARCVARGHTCEYAPETKRLRCDETANDDEEDSTAASQTRRHFHSPFAHRRVAMAIPKRLRIDTLLDSHEMPALTGTALGKRRRRHSTIELPVSLPILDPKRTRSALRKHRLAAQASRKDGFLGLPSDSFSSFPKDGADDDDDDDDASFHVGSTISTYQTPTRLSTFSQDAFAHTSLSPNSPEYPANISPGDLSQFRFPQSAWSQPEWEASPSQPPKSAGFTDAKALLHAPDFFVGHNASAGLEGFASGLLRYSTSMPELGYAYQADSKDSAYSKPNTFDFRGAEFNYDMEANPSFDSMSAPIIWPSTALAKSAKFAYPHNVIRPDIDTTLYSPDFLSFNQ